jgi:serine/threonine-protein kinase
MMPCPEEDTLFALVRGELARERAGAIAAHADDCPSCQTALGEVARLVMGGARARAPRRRVEPLHAGQVVAGRYTLGQLLGEGGAGEVWSAEPLDGGAPVALKFLRWDDARLLQRLLREAKLARSLQHPNLLAVHDVLAIADRPPALVLELLRGESLASRLTKGPLPRAASVLAEVCDAVAALHAARILHRDLKPANVFLTRRDGRDDWPRVLDLGMAKRTDDARGTTRPTTVGTLLGTPRYMAPEQLVAAGELDERADVWALGAILYEAVSGTPHVDAHRPAHVLRAIGRGVRPLAEVAPHAPPAALDVAMRMLSVDRKRRPSAAEAAAALRSA